MVIVAPVSKTACYILIRPKVGIYTYSRVVPSEASKPGSGFEAEFLTNAPTDAKEKITKALLTISIPDSGRVFINPSGIL